MKNLTWILALAGLGIGLLLGGCADLDLSAAGRRIAETRTVRVTGAVVNLRAGPGLDHAVLGQVQAGDRLPVTGRTASGAWLHVTPTGQGRWIYGDLTNIPAEVRQDLPGLDYEWELVFTDDSAAWDWRVADFPGCYDALRVFLGDLPRTYGLRRAEIILSDTVRSDFFDWEGDPAGFQRRVGTYAPGTVAYDRETLGPLWPDWHAGNLPHPDFAFVSGVCTHWPDRTGVDNGEFTCTLHPVWGQPDSAYLNGVASAGVARALGSILFGEDVARDNLDWQDRAWPHTIYLYPQDARNQPAGQGPCLRLTRP